MLRRDYIQKMVEEFARVVAHVLQLNMEGKSEEALRRLRDSYTTFFNENPEMISALLPSQLLKKLVDGDGLTPGQIEVLAQGLRAEADLLMDSDQRQAKDRYVKALAFYEYAELNDQSNFSISRRNSIEEIKHCISAL